MELFNIFSETYGKEKAQTIVKNIEEIVDSHKQDLATKMDILDLKKEVKEVELKLAKEIEQAKSSTIKWVVGLIIAQTAAIISVMLIK